MIANQSRKRKGFLEPIPDSPFDGRLPESPFALYAPLPYFINFVTASV